MKEKVLTISENKNIAAGIWKMTFEGDDFRFIAPGQFINIKLPGLYLRRPISVCDADASRLVIIYKAVGKGTDLMTTLEPGEKLEALCGLGNGFVPDKNYSKPLLVGGGVGVPPMYFFTETLINSGFKPKVILGFNTKDDVFYADEFKALGCEVALATADGSLGVKGFVTDALKYVGDFDSFYCCGPMPMLKALNRTIPGHIPGYFSFEERMGCGFGACMGCSIAVKGGYKRVCKDGPVLAREEIIWED